MTTIILCRYIFDGGGNTPLRYLSYITNGYATLWALVMFTSLFFLAFVDLHVEVVGSFLFLAILRNRTFANCVLF